MSTGNMPGPGGKGVRITSVWWQLTLCDPISDLMSTLEVSHIMRNTNRRILYFTYCTYSLQPGLNCNQLAYETHG